MWHFPKVLLIYIFSGMVLVFGQFGNVSAGERVVIPKIPKALAAAEKGHAELMRRNHMDLMIHKRDQTVHEGIRSENYSLKACISCHAVLGEDKKPVSVASTKHFCRTCHDYAAVKVDCFQCHTSKPPPSFVLDRGSSSFLSKQMQEYLR